MFSLHGQCWYRAPRHVRNQQALAEGEALYALMLTRGARGATKREIPERLQVERLLRDLYASSIVHGLRFPRRLLRGKRTGLVSRAPVAEFFARRRAPRAGD